VKEVLGRDLVGLALAAGSAGVDLQDRVGARRHGRQGGDLVGLAHALEQRPERRTLGGGRSRLT
jgi:hypothetical protein